MFERFTNNPHTSMSIVFSLIILIICLVLLLGDYLPDKPAAKTLVTIIAGLSGFLFLIMGYALCTNSEQQFLSRVAPDTVVL